MAQHIDTVQQEREELTNAYQALKETLESALDTLHNYYQQAHQQLDTPSYIVNSSAFKEIQLHASELAQTISNA